mmetsp:Transcript_39089/g.39793  ORF Transcript_39089/g.39793 Transcript_39089/m.39793 type:complete len:251 (+) Transcript_39089:316-1068(+)
METSLLYLPQSPSDSLGVVVEAAVKTVIELKLRDFVVLTIAPVSVLESALALSRDLSYSLSFLKQNSGYEAQISLMKSVEEESCSGVMVVIVVDVVADCFRTPSSLSASAPAPPEAVAGAVVDAVVLSPPPQTLDAQLCSCYTSSSLTVVCSLKRRNVEVKGSYILDAALALVAVEIDADAADRIAHLILVFVSDIMTVTPPPLPLRPHPRCFLLSLSLNTSLLLLAALSYLLYLRDDQICSHEADWVSS